MTEYQKGYQDCLDKLNNILDSALQQEAIHLLTGAMALRLLRMSLDPDHPKIYE